MKDPNDKQTIDGFANLVTQFEKDNGIEPGSVPSRGVSFGELRLFTDHIQSLLDADEAAGKKKRGRKPAGEKALTAAEKQKAYRDRKRERLAAIKAGEPVESKLIDLTTDFATAYKEKSKQT